MSKDIPAPISRDGDIRQHIARSTHSPLAGLFRRQEFWITIGVLLVAAVVSLVAPRFASPGNIGNMAQNFSFTALLALGMMPVIISGGIDISVGSILGFAAVMFALMMSGGNPFWLSALVGVGSGTLLGVVNGVLIALVRLPPFIVTLAMLSGARSLTLIVTNNQIVYSFGPDQDLMTALGSGWLLGIPNVTWVVILAGLLVFVLLTQTAMGRWIHAIGGNEEAARSVGIPVDWVKLAVYAFSGFMCGITAVMMVGWLGSVTNALGTGQELQVIAAAVIGGGSLSGGVGSAYGAIIGSVLVEVIRNALLLAGVNPFWQGLFVAAFIIFAVLLERLKSVRG